MRAGMELLGRFAPLCLVALGAVAPSLAQEEAEEEIGYAFLSEDDVRGALEETLSQPEFERLRSRPEEPQEEAETPAWLERFLRWLKELMGPVEESGTSSQLGSSLVTVLLYGMAALILGAAVVFLLKSALSISRDKKVTEEREEIRRTFQSGAAPGELPPEEYWRRALEHGENRRFKDGIRELLLGAMSATERRGLIRFRRGLTNRDYFYAVRGSARESFHSIASTFEHVYFGRRDASADSFRECCREYQKSFGGASA